MKSLKKILALAISLCLLIGAVPMFAMAEDAASDAPVITYTYENDMSELASEDGYSNIYKFGKDFYFRFDNATNWDNDTFVVEPKDLRYYTVALNGKLERQANINVETGNDPCRAYVNQLFMYHKQPLTNFETSIEYSKVNPSAFNIIHFSPKPSGYCFNDGFVVAFRANKDDSTTTDVVLNTAAGSKTNLGDWYLKSGINIKTNVADINTFKVTMKNGTATLYVNDTYVTELTGLATDKYYIGYSLGHAGGAIDNISITSTDEINVDEGWVREESDGVYKNNFDTTDWDTFDNDFAFSINYDSDRVSNDQVTSYKTVSDALLPEKAIDFYNLNGTFKRQKNYPENGETRAFRSFYAYYKNQTFNEFELNVDMEVPDNGSFTMIHFTPELNGTVYSNGITFSVEGRSKNLRVLFGNYNSARASLNGWRTDPVTMEITAETTPAYTTGNTIKVKIVFADETATLYIDDVEIKTIDVPADNYYVGLAGSVSCASFDNLSIVGDKNLSFAGTDGKTLGMYANNVNVDEIGYKVSDGANTVEVTADVIDDWALGTAPFAVTKDGEVYYTDLNDDGDYTADDIIALREYLAYIGDVNADRADLTGDSYIDIRDLVRMKKVEVNAADGYAPADGVYTFAFSLVDVLKGVADGEITVTPYYVSGDSAIYGEDITLTVANGVIVAE